MLKTKSFKTRLMMTVIGLVMVSTLVVDAIGYWAFSFWPNSTRPLAPSISTAPFAATVNGSDARAAGRQSSMAQINKSTLFMTASANDVLPYSVGWTSAEND